MLLQYFTLNRYVTRYYFIHESPQNRSPIFIKMSALSSNVFQINVPVDEDKGLVTVVLYNSPKFFPDEEIVEDVTYDIAEQLKDSKRVRTLSIP